MQTTAARKDTPSKRSSRSKRRVAIQFSMCLMLFVWPLYRSSSLSASIQQDRSDDSIFGPDNLDSASKHVPCGEYKCFFQSKGDQSVGFLVAPSIRKKNTNFQWFGTLQSGWKLSQELQNQYGIQHFLMEPPIKVKVSSKLAKRLNKHLYSEKKSRLIRGKKSSRFPKGSTAFVQKVKTAPKRSLLLGCGGSKIDMFKRNMKNFVKDIKYQESFEQNFQHGLDTAKEMLQKEPCLTKDFQALVDDKGNFHHLDFDRCFKPDAPDEKYEISQEESRDCLKALDNLDKRLQSKLSIS